MMMMTLRVMIMMYLSNLFDGLKGVEEGGEEIGKDRQEVDYVHEAFYELPPVIVIVQIYWSNGWSWNIGHWRLMWTTKVWWCRWFHLSGQDMMFDDMIIWYGYKVWWWCHLSGQDMNRTRNSRVNQVMYIASRISIVSFESEIRIILYEHITYNLYFSFYFFIKMYTFHLKYFPHAIFSSQTGVCQISGLEKHRLFLNEVTL